MANTVELDEEEENTIRDLHLLSGKPMLYVENIAELTNNPSLITDNDKNSLRISVKLESEIVDMNPQEQLEFLKDYGLEESGLDRLIKKCYEMLNLITFFTSGEKESRAWTVKTGTKAPQAAGVIHTDFEKAFIRAEVIYWKDFVELLGEVGVKEAGKQRIEGKDYILKDGDVCYFRVGV